MITVRFEKQSLPSLRGYADLDATSIKFKTSEVLAFGGFGSRVRDRT